MRVGIIIVLGFCMGVILEKLGKKYNYSGKVFIILWVLILIGISFFANLIDYIFEFIRSN